MYYLDIVIEIIEKCKPKSKSESGIVNTVLPKVMS